jgi:hypothetical protein
MKISKKYKCVYGYQDIHNLNLKLIESAAEHPNLIYTGYVKDEKMYFTISRKIIIRDSFCQFFSGTIEKCKEGLVIKGGFKYNKIVLIVGIMIYFLLISQLLLELAHIGSYMETFIPLGMLCFVILCHILITLLSMNKRKEIIEFLETVFR